jgi:hypothetical protein
MHIDYTTLISSDARVVECITLSPVLYWLEEIQVQVLVLA